MFAPPICRRRWRNNAFPFRQLRRRRRQAEHRSERSEQSNTARGASSYETLLRASGIARRRAEEEEQTTLYRLRATTKSADPSAMREQL